MIGSLTWINGTSKPALPGLPVYNTREHKLFRVQFLSYRHPLVPSRPDKRGFSFCM